MSNIIDYALIQDNSGLFDIVIDTNNNCFQGVQGNETAVKFQLFLDRRASKNQVYSPRNRQGWIADIFTKQSNYETGSFIYLKNQARNTQKDMNEISAFAVDALKYFIQIGAAKKIKASVVGNTITGTIEVDGSPDNQFNLLWRNVGLATI